MSINGTGVDSAVLGGTVASVELSSADPLEAVGVEVGPPFTPLFGRFNEQALMSSAMVIIVNMDRSRAVDFFIVTSKIRIGCN
jgi:hypothetical protein